MTPARDWFGHPRGLTVLAATEMWEVFSFVGMKTLLVYYMVKELGFGQARASLIYGGYAGFAYLAPIVGAVLCDRLLGRRRAVIIGGLLMSLGHFLLVFPALFAPALVAVALGAGLYLPSLPSQIGALYEARDPRRTWAYNIYYMGMNTGSLIAPLICGTLGELFGWHWGFGAAGIGMLLGVAIYVLGARHLPADAPLPQQKRSSSRHGLPGWHRFGLMAVLALCVMLYRGANEQTGNTLALWLDTGVDRRLAGLTIPMTWFQSLNPVMVLLLTPLLVFHWKGAAARGSVPSDVARMAMGAAILAGGFVFLAGVVRLDGASTNPGWVVAFFVILTVGELYMMPAALAVFNRLAPTGFVALGAALWFLTASGGNLIAGALGTLWSSMPPVAFFLMLAAVSASAGLFLRLLVRAVAEADARIADEARSPRPRMA